MAEFEKDELADNSDDEKRLFKWEKAEKREELTKKKGETNKR